MLPLVLAAVVSKDIMDRSNSGASTSPVSSPYSSFREKSLRSSSTDESDDDGNTENDKILKLGEEDEDKEEEEEVEEDVNDDHERSLSPSHAPPSSRRNRNQPSPRDSSKDESYRKPKGKSGYNIQAAEHDSVSSDERLYGSPYRSHDSGSVKKLTRVPIHDVQGPQEQGFKRVQTKTMEQGSTTKYMSISSSTSQSFANIRPRGWPEKPASPVINASSPQMRRRTSTVQAQTYKTLFEEYFNLGLALLFLFLITLIMALSLCSTSPDDQLNSNDALKLNLDEILNDFLEAFDRLNGSFPAQTSMFWKVLRAGTRSIMRQNPPEQPAVFIIAVPQGAEQTALCIARRYADIVTKAFKVHGTIEFLQHLRGADTPEHIKEVIDDTLNSGFSRGSKVAIVHELNRLHGESAMMFHGYCDNENAPFTRVAFVLMLHMDAIGGETDDLVERRLSNVWGSYLDRDTLLPLLSRIGNRNAFVRQESDEVLQANGC